jgi:hypothetical protein
MPLRFMRSCRRGKPPTDVRRLCRVRTSSPAPTKSSRQAAQTRATDFFQRPPTVATIFIPVEGTLSARPQIA